MTLYFYPHNGASLKEPKSKIVNFSKNIKKEEKMCQSPLIDCSNISSYQEIFLLKTGNFGL